MFGGKKKWPYLAAGWLINSGKLQPQGHVSTLHATLLTAPKGGMNYTAGGMAVKRLEQRPAKEMALRRVIEQLLEESWMCQMWNVET
jgi:hypothetical protein